MYRTNKISTGSQKCGGGYEGEPIEAEIRRMMNNKEPIEGTAGVKVEYTDRKDGVINRFNIRNDKWEEVADGMDKVAELHGLQREARIGEREYDKWDKEKQAEFNKKFPNNKHALSEKMGGDI